MKRSEMLRQMQIAYHIRHVMVESGHLSLEDFMNELLTHMEDKGMKPPENSDGFLEWDWDKQDYKKFKGKDDDTILD